MMQTASPASGISLREVETAMIQAAEIAAIYPEYLCLYARMEREYIMLRDGQDVLNRALALANRASQVEIQSLPYPNSREG